MVGAKKRIHKGKARNQRPGRGTNRHPRTPLAFRSSLRHSQRHLVLPET